MVCFTKSMKIKWLPRKINETCMYSMLYFFKITLTFTSDSRKMNDANISHFKMFRSTIQKAMQFQQHMKTCIHEHLVCWMLFFIEERSYKEKQINTE